MLVKAVKKQRPKTSETQNSQFLKKQLYQTCDAESYKNKKMKLKKTTNEPLWQWVKEPSKLNKNMSFKETININNLVK